MNKLNNDYNPRNPEKVEEKKRALESAKKLLRELMREKILLIFLKKGFFRIKVMYLKQKKNQKMNQKLNQEMNQKKNQKKKVKKIIEYIEKESKDINYDLFKDYFNFLIPSALAKKNI